MVTSRESIMTLLEALPPTAVAEVADFVDYLYRKHTPLPIDEHLARRKANRWLIEWVGNLVMADQPVLMRRAGNPVWRFGAFMTSLKHPPVGPIGFVEIDATTGHVLADQNHAQELQRAGETLISPA